MTSKVEKFIAQLTPIYGPPYKDKSGSVIPIMIKHLDPFPEDVLMRAAEEIIVTHQYATWPKMVEILAMCELMKIKLYPAPATKTRKKAPLEDWTDDRCVAADRMILSDVGVNAAVEGWLDQLWHFCRKQLSYPDGREIPLLIDAANVERARFDKTFEKIEDHSRWKPSSSGIRNSLAELAGKMMKQSARRFERVKQWGIQHGYTFPEEETHVE